MNNVTVSKVLILGIDAIEYDLVEQWDLKNLKQLEYGKTILPITRKDGYYYSEPVTTIIWPSFITGLPPRKHGIDTLKKHFLIPLYRQYLKVTREKKEDDHLTPLREYKTAKRKIFDELSKVFVKLNLSREFKRADIRATTIFDSIKSQCLHVPVYHTDAFPHYKKKIVEAIENRAYRPIFEIQCSKEFNHRTKEVFTWLEKKEEWNLFMQYFFVLDAVQHVFFNNEKKIAKFYIMFDEFIRQIRNTIDDDTLLLIVSDHGQKKGIHTTYGFYSANKPLDLKNPRLTDFRWIIEDLLREEREYNENK